jgi:hypothetical protein
MRSIGDPKEIVWEIFDQKLYQNGDCIRDSMDFMVGNCIGDSAVFL